MKVAGRFPESVDDIVTLMTLGVGPPPGLPLSFLNWSMCALLKKPKVLGTLWLDWMQTQREELIKPKYMDWLLTQVFGTADHTPASDWDSIVRDIGRILTYPCWMTTFTIDVAADYSQRVADRLQELHTRELTRMGYEDRDGEALPDSPVPLADLMQLFSSHLIDVSSRVSLLDPVLEVALRSEDVDWIKELMRMTGCRPRRIPEHMRGTYVYFEESVRCFGGLELLRLRYPAHWERVGEAIHAPLTVVGLGETEDFVARVICRPRLSAIAPSHGMDTLVSTELEHATV